MLQAWFIGALVVSMIGYGIQHATDITALNVIGLVIFALSTFVAVIVAIPLFFQTWFGDDS